MTKIVTCNHENFRSSCSHCRESLGRPFIHLHHVLYNPSREDCYFTIEASFLTRGEAIAYIKNSEGRYPHIDYEIVTSELRVEKYKSVND